MKKCLFFYFTIENHKKKYYNKYEIKKMKEGLVC